MEVHPPHHPLHSWKDFGIHIATIIVGLLIAIGLEQSVEALHHRHQRHQLEDDLHEEAVHNQQLLLRDLTLQQQEMWFQAAMTHSAGDGMRDGKVSFMLPRTPCSPGSLGTAQMRYFAPSEAVWTTAKESGLAGLVPAEQARIYARLSHNDDLLGVARDEMAKGCDKLSAMETRFAVTAADGASETWAMKPEQVEEFAAAAAETNTALRALVFRLRWTLAYEEAILRGVRNVDEMMMVINQQGFES